MSSFIASLLFCFVAVALTPLAYADSIVVAFSDPVLSGTVMNYSRAGQAVFVDNSRTASYRILNNNSGSFLLWGTSGVSGRGQVFSELVAVGSEIPADTSAPFELATFTYTNGDSASNTEIFGATISFYDNVISSSTFLGSDQLIITSTGNVFEAPGNLKHGDDDYISICGHQSNLCSTAIEAVESDEGGSSVTVHLFGMIPIDSTPVTITPEPGSFSLLLTGGLAGSWLWKRRHSVRNH